MNGHSKRTGEESCDGLSSDRQLLARFVDRDDEDAFAELLARYYGLVLGVCRRTFRDEHSAEDAFQATFLVLARRAPQIRSRSSLAGWLYAVAYRTALRARAKRHQRREEALREDMMATDDILAQITTRGEQQLLDEELNSLPAKFREPLVLRYLMGKSNKQVASELGLRVGVVEGRIKTGKREMLMRLARRGISLTGALAAVSLSPGVLEAATTDWLLAATVQTAAAFRTGVQPAGEYSQSAVQLAKQELAMKTSTVAATTSCATGALVVAGLAIAWASSAGQQPAQAEDPNIVATAHAELPGAPPAEGGRVPVQLAAAEGREADSDPGSDPPSAEEKIDEALREPTEFEFIETPLADVIDEIASNHGVNILIDHRALDDVGIVTDCPVTFRLSDVSLRSGLNLILQPLDLTWTIRDEVLFITTPEEAEQMLVTKVYDVGDLVMCQDKAGERWPDYQTPIDLIVSTIEPTSWEDVGGPASIAPAPLAGADMLAISQTCQGHHRIDQVLDQLRAIAQEKGNGELPVREKPDWYSGGMSMGTGMEGLGGPDRSTQDGPTGSSRD